MKIDAFNGEIINTNKIDVHDCIFKDLRFDYSKKSISVSLLNSNPEKGIITVGFFNVLGFNMISCDFWGKSPHVLDWEFVSGEEQLLTRKLFEERDRYNYLNSKLDDVTNHIETVMTLTSGDVLAITCEYIDLQ